MSIFVSIASYRDKDCRETLNNLYETATRPESIYVGICEQNHPGEADEVCSAAESVPAGNVRRVVLHHNDARGPCWARYLCSTLYQGEEYYLQIDSHMRFVKDWDSKLVAMLHGLESSNATGKVVVSTYVRSVDDYDAATHQARDELVPQICQAVWESDEIPTLRASLLPAPTSPPQLPFVAGGLMFLRAHPFLDEVPFDPELKDVFLGEEILFSARLWTAGYDIFPLSENIGFHKYTRSDEVKFWDDNPRDDTQSMRRLRYVLQLTTRKPTDGAGRSLDRYGLGNARTLDAYWAFAGINPKARTSTRDLCQANLMDSPVVRGHRGVARLQTMAAVCSCLMLLLAALYAVFRI